MGDIKKRAEERHKALNEAMDGLDKGVKERLAKKLLKRLTSGYIHRDDILQYAKDLTNRYIRRYGRKDETV